MKAFLRAVPAAVLGLFVAHQITYERAAADVGAHHAAMSLGYQTWLPSLPAILLVASLGALVLARSTRRNPSAKLPGPLTILAVQWSLFMVMQTADRLLNDCCLLPETPVLIAGLAAQIPTALLSWAAMRFVLVPLADTVLRVVTLVVTPAPAVSPRALPVVTVLRSLAVLTLSAPRAPPVGA